MWKYEENQIYTCRDSTLTVDVFSQQLWSYFDNSSHSNLTSFSIYTHFFLLVKQFQVRSAPFNLIILAFSQI